MIINRLNSYVKSVREYSNPFYFNIRGKFIIVDSFGTHLGEWGTLLNPEEIDNIKKRISLIDSQIKELEESKK